MRILINTVFLTSERLGGSWTHTAQLVWHLTSQKGPHEYLVLVNELVAEQFPVSEVSGKKIIVRLDAHSRIKRIAWEQTQLPRLVKSLGPDLLHSTGNTLPLFVPCAAVVSINDLQVYHYPENFPTVRRKYLHAITPRTVKRADRIITISEYTRQDVLHRFPVVPEKVVTIHLAGLTDGEASAVPSVDDLRSRYRLPDRFLLSVGSSLPHKNLVRMIEAYAQAVGDIPDSLVIVGEGFSQRSALKDALDLTRLTTSGRVVLLDYVPRRDLLGLYAAATAFVFPSLFEGFGIPALEAMECGCPVIASNGTALAEIVGDAGVLFDPMDCTSIASAIRLICRDPELRKTLIDRGRARVPQFSWTQTAEKTVRVYEEVGEEQRRKRQ